MEAYPDFLNSISFDIGFIITSSICLSYLFSTAPKQGEILTQENITIIARPSVFFLLTFFYSYFPPIKFFLRM